MPEHQWKANPWVCVLTFDTIHHNAPMACGPNVQLSSIGELV